MTTVFFLAVRMTTSLHKTMPTMRTDTMTTTSLTTRTIVTSSFEMTTMDIATTIKRMQ